MGLRYAPRALPSVKQPFHDRRGRPYVSGTPGPCLAASGSRTEQVGRCHKPVERILAQGILHLVGAAGVNRMVLRELQIQGPVRLLSTPTIAAATAFPALPRGTADGSNSDSRGRSILAQHPNIRCASCRMYFFSPWVDVTTMRARDMAGRLSLVCKQRRHLACYWLGQHGNSHQHPLK